MTSCKAPNHLFNLLVLMAVAMPAPILAQSGGYYLEFSAGSTKATAESLLPLTGNSQVTESTLRSDSYTLAGGWRLNDNIAVEITYTDHGSFSDQAVLTDRFTVVERDPVTEEDVFSDVDARLDGEVDYELQSYGAHLVGVWPLSPRWSVFGRIGLLAWEADSRIDGHLSYRGDLDRDWNVSGKLSDNGSSFSYGLGLFYRFNRSYGAKLEYQHSRIDSDIFSSDPKLGAWSFGVRYYF